jgi:enhancer of polycomb-like protein
LRQDFEFARGLVKDVLQREHMRRATFQLEKQIFEQRRTACDLKRKLNIRDTDEDLINKVYFSQPSITFGLFILTAC